MVHDGEEREQSHYCCHLLRGAGCGISHLLCLQSGKVWHLPFVYERDWLCWVALMMVARLLKPKILLNFELWVYHDLGCSICLYGWPAQWLVVVLCCCSYLSLTMTYPSRVCLASSFLFSSRSSGTRRRSGGPLQPIMRVPHRQSLLPVRLRTPAPLNRNARWRSQST